MGCVEPVPRILRNERGIWYCEELGLLSLLLQVLEGRISGEAEREILGRNKQALVYSVEFSLRYGMKLESNLS